MIKELAVIIGVPVVRSAFGWLQNSLKDGFISEYEWGLLGETILRVGLIGAATYYGLGVYFDIPIVAAGAAAFMIDKLLSALKKK